jgi:methylthioribose-1-phosphate isomerase
MCVTIEWKDNRVRYIDQTKLPGRIVYREIADYRDIIDSIKALEIRGAPAIGVAGAMAVLLSAYDEVDDPIDNVRKASKEIAAARPTAVNLKWAVDAMLRRLDEVKDEAVESIRRVLEDEAMRIWREDQDACKAMGDFGADLLTTGMTVLTHCNAGALAAVDYGTALSVIYSAVESGKRISVYADETRPLLQGARLTAWELKQRNIDVTIICDSAAGYFISMGKIDAVIVGSDRIASNGDVANKVGTYPLSVLAARHGVPFYVVAPLSTIDPSLGSGKDIPIEMRDSDEITSGFCPSIAPEGVRAENPAFDVTPAGLVTAIVTEVGVLKPPYEESISSAFESAESD